MFFVFHFSELKYGFSDVVDVVSGAIPEISTPSRSGERMDDLKTIGNS